MRIAVAASERSCLARDLSHTHIGVARFRPVAIAAQPGERHLKFRRGISIDLLVGASLQMIKGLRLPFGKPFPARASERVTGLRPNISDGSRAAEHI